MAGKSVSVKSPGEDELDIFSELRLRAKINNSIKVVKRGRVCRACGRKCPPGEKVLVLTMYTCYKDCISILNTMLVARAQLPEPPAGSRARKA